MKFFPRIDTNIFEDKSLLSFLILLILLIFVIYPLSDESLLMKIIYNIILTLILISSTLSIDVRRELKWMLILFAFIVFFSNILSIYVDYDPLTIIHLIIRTLFLYLVAYFILKKILFSSEITVYSIAGSITVYLLLGVIWALNYTIIYKISESSFIFTQEKVTENTVVWSFLYYSFTTLTTLGYGDILPNGPIARSFAMLEGLIGQLYPVILIDRLVSSNIATNK